MQACGHEQSPLLLFQHMVEDDDNKDGYSLLNPHLLESSSGSRLSE